MLSTLTRLLIRLYRKWISPLKQPSCRFYPTCSAYALQAFEQETFMKASYLTCHRLCRCHPWNDGGFDPLPPREKSL